MSQTTNQQPPTADPANRSSNHHAETDLDLDLDLGLDLDRGDSDSTKVSVITSPLLKQMIEALCYEFYDTSQSSGLAHAAVQAYTKNAGKIHPGAILSDELEEITAEAILAGEVDSEDLPDEYTLEGEDEAEAFDLDDQDNRGRASSYTATFTPDDLANEGRALTWDELKDSVPPRWGPDLEIHPDRVDAERLKQNRKFNAKVIAGILRNQHATVSDSKIETYIEDYLGHQIGRADYDEGLRFKIRKHKPLIIKHLEAYPGINGGIHYTSAEAAEDKLPQVVDTIRDHFDESRATSPDSWTARNLTTMDTLKSDGDTLEEWLSDLSKYRRKLAKLNAIIRNGGVMEHLYGNVEFDEEEYADVADYLSSLHKEMKAEYLTAPAHARYVVWNEYLNLDNSFSYARDEETEAVIDFDPYENDDGQMPKIDQLKIVANNLDG